MDPPLKRLEHQSITERLPLVEVDGSILHTRGLFTVAGMNGAHFEAALIHVDVVHTCKS